MGEDNTERTTSQCGFDHAPRIDGCTIDGSLFQRFDSVTQKPVARIEITDLEDFVLQRADAHAPEARDSFGIGKHVAFFTALLEVQSRGRPNDLECYRRDAPDTGDGTELFDGCIEDAAEVTEARDERLGRLLYVGAGNRERQE